MEKKYFRNCPDCGKELGYTEKNNCKMAESRQSSCISCVRKKSAIIRKRNCPDCKKEIFYATSNELKTAEKKQSICKDCFHKKKIYVYNCSWCNAEMIYTKRYLYERAVRVTSCCSFECRFEKKFQEAKEKYENSILGNFKIITYYRDEKGIICAMVECLTCGLTSKKYFSPSGFRRCKFCSRKKYDVSKPASQLMLQDTLEKSAIIVVHIRTEKRGLTINLADKEIIDLMNSPCHYCGIIGSVASTHPSKNHEYIWKHNGIDRIDSAQGYIRGNVVSCCKTCNYMKRHHPIDEFLSHIERIHKHQQSILSQ